MRATILNARGSDPQPAAGTPRRRRCDHARHRKADGCREFEAGWIRAERPAWPGHAVRGSRPRSCRPARSARCASRAAAAPPRRPPRRGQRRPSQSSARARSGSDGSPTPDRRQERPAAGQAEPAAPPPPTSSRLSSCLRLDRSMPRADTTASQAGRPSWQPPGRSPRRDRTALANEPAAAQQRLTRGRGCESIVDSIVRRVVVV